MAQRGKRHIDQQLTLALACGASVESAARQAGVSESTVYRRRAEPQFRQRLEQLRAEMIERTAAMLTAAGLEAVKTLLALQQASVSAAVRLGAARAVLETGIKVREVADTERRLAVLEEQVALQQTP